jgi:hypothetical protein
MLFDAKSTQIFLGRDICRAWGSCYLRKTRRRAARGEAYLLRDPLVAAAEGSQRAVDERRWGVVQPVGHLTVNEDGEGSNPSAPAKFSLWTHCRFFLATLWIRSLDERSWKGWHR